MWLLMETCPENRPVFVKYGREIFERARVGNEIGTLDDPRVFALPVDRYDGWHPIIEWRTDKAPRTGEWLLVTWHTGVRRYKVRWSKDMDEFVYPSGVLVVENWLAWTYDLPDFVPPPKPVDDLAGKSVDELVTEIKRLTEHLAEIVNAE